MAVCLSVAFVSPASAFSFGKHSKQSKVVAVASSYVGLHERTNRKALKAKLGIDPYQTPWCAAFVNSVLKQRGIKGSGGNKASSFLRWGKSTKSPKPGDIVVLNDHVGIFVSFSKTRKGKVVNVLGGNQSNKVRVSSFSTKKVRSYRTF